MTEHKHGWPYDEDPPRCTELSARVCIRPTVHGGNPDVIDSKTGEISGGPTEHLAGFIIAYDWPGFDYRLEGGVTVDQDLPEPRWSMTGSLETNDLTLSPSVQAYRYDHDTGAHTPTIHGYVRNGKWEEA